MRFIDGFLVIIMGRERVEGDGVKLLMMQSQDFIFVQVKVVSRESLLAVTLL